MAIEAANNETPMLTLRTSDGKKILVSECAAMLSVTIKHMLEDDDCEKNEIPLPNVQSKTLDKIIAYLNEHAKYESLSEDEKEEKQNKKFKEDQLKQFDDNFVSDEPDSVLFDCVLAANYLNIKGLMDIVCGKIADQIKYKNVEAVRAKFNIKSDFEPEEEAAIRNENEWAFEDVDPCR